MPNIKTIASARQRRQCLATVLSLSPLMQSCSLSRQSSPSVGSEYSKLELWRNGTPTTLLRVTFSPDSIAGQPPSDATKRIAFSRAEVDSVRAPKGDPTKVIIVVTAAVAALWLVFGVLARGNSGPGS